MIVHRGKRLPVRMYLGSYLCVGERECARARERRQRRREDNEDDDDEEGDEGEEENVLQSLSLLAHSSPSSYRYEAAQ